MNLKLFLSAALVFAATLSSSLSAQEGSQTKQYYATFEIEGKDTVLYIRGYDKKPELVENKIIYVQDQELNSWIGDSGNLENQWGGTQVYSHLARRAKLEVDENFKPTSTRNWFLAMYNLRTIEGLENLNTSEVKDMRSMFDACLSLTGVNFSNFNTGNVEDMRWLFLNCAGIKDLDLSTFNMEKVTQMTSMFGANAVASIHSVYLGKLNTENVTKINWMFSHCTNLKYIFVDEGSKISTASVTDDDWCFKDCNSLVGVAIDGTEVKWDSTIDWEKSNYAKGYFKTADKDGYFTQISSAKEVELTVLPTNLKYNIGGRLDLSGGYLTRVIEFGGGRTYEMQVCALEALIGTAKGFDNTKVGKCEVSVTYAGKDYSFEVEVIDDSKLKEVVVVSEPSLKTYKRPVTKEDLDLRDGVIKKVYESGVEESFKMEELTYTVDGLDAIKVGENTLKINFDLKDTTFVWEYKIVVEDAASEKFVEVSSLLVYPNPTSDFVRISGMPEGVCAVKLLNAAGNVVLSTVGAGSETTLDLSKLTAGSYLIVVENGTKRIVERIVKM